MKIEINGKIYNDVVWTFDHANGESSLLLKTNDSISEVAAAFDGDDTINAYDDNNVKTGVWYVHAVTAIYANYESRTPEEPREVVVKLKASALTTEAEEELNSNINENIDAIMEIAEMIANVDDVSLEIERIKSRLDGFPVDIVQQLDAINTAYNTLADRVARLENAQ